ncbi:MAG: hypothetical protein KatS3mg105_2254 [Gemmatales bacterium]|nr:MAG: hypothetical protein KatS3mg105_2254 [Gemmatales bacterium]
MKWARGLVILLQCALGISTASSAEPLPNQNILATHFQPQSEQHVVRVLARVNGVAILEDELRSATLPQILNPSVARLPDAERQKAIHKIRQEELQNLIDRELLIDDLMRRVGKNRPQYLERLQEAASKELNQHLKQVRKRMENHLGRQVSDQEFERLAFGPYGGLAGYKRQFERRFISMEYLKALLFPRARVAIGHQQIVDYYHTHRAEFEVADRVEWYDIFIDKADFRSDQEARQFAGQIVQRARQGADFVELAKKYDRGESAYRGGRGQGELRGEIQPPELEAILFRMKPGQIGPVVEVANGFHVFKLDKREYAGIKPLTPETQDIIKRKLQNAFLMRESKRIVSELRRQAAIEISDEFRRHFESAQVDQASTDS